MIFKHHVKRVANDVLQITLGQQSPGVYRFLTEPVKFGKFVELLHERLNQLELAGYVRSASAIDKFIRSATIRYAEVQLERAGNLKPKEEKNSDGAAGHRIQAV